MFSAIGLKKSYYPKRGPEVRALKGVSIGFGERGMVFILGKSGSGKSTLLYILGGLDYPDEGELVLDGRSTRDFAPKDFNDFRNESVGFVFQEYNLLPTFTVRDNLAVALELQGKTVDLHKIGAALKKVELSGMEERKPNELSGGQKQRVAIARALVKEPKIILADEPTGALDENTGNAILTLLKELSKEKLVIVVSHDREFAEKYGDRIIELADGAIVADSAAGGAAAGEATAAGGVAAAGAASGKSAARGIVRP
ncbi:MAG TPA: ABC transporter ATP-binding protein [Candidatus Gallimonas intestinavium]|uniref:ABC transporter ATP-binding protein n=1 Tax=Candidatus Gallimonas intestinavium TaxID=2838603 RepID=A0A9D2G6X2_9FIRM|nr:ABC transporter ATP-binding protein [Candidatus Gallimonas intestinavium]